MANLALYPPIVDSYTPAFIAGEEAICRVYFSLSSFNIRSDFETVQATVVKQDSGISVVNDTVDDVIKGRYRATGIILNLVPTKVSGKDNLYYIDILNSDLKSVDDENHYQGWIPGWIYKIQLRLSTVTYEGDGRDQAQWLNLHGADFSEWSTINITKAIGKETITIYNFNFEGINTDDITYLTELNFYGYYKNEDSSELLNNYRIVTELEDSGVIPAKNDKNSLQYFTYVFKKDYELHTPYTITFTYETINKYTNTYVLNFILEEGGAPFNSVKALTYEEDPSFMQDFTTPSLEQDNGGILLKLYSEEDTPYIGSMCIRRSDNKSNFTEWSDISIINLKNESVNDIPPFYDLTIESGVFYKYGVQFIDTLGYRTALNKNETISLREFEFSFLLGENGKQLKLKFNNEMNNFKINVSESKTDTLGGKFSFFSRNGDTYYKSFPINGLISFNMDDNNLFTSRSELFGESLYKYDQYRKQHSLIYDYIYEKAFRDKVLEFLYDGKYKLFKSPTEGNIIVRLMEINCSPTRAVNRMIYSFSCNAYEADDFTLENCLKYNFYHLNDFSSDIFEEVESHSTKVSFTITKGADLIELLVAQLKTYVEIEGITYSKEVCKIYNIMLSFQNTAPSNIHKISCNNNNINIYDESIYDLSDYLAFEPSKDSLKVLDDVSEIIVDVYCDYDTINKVYQTSTESGEISRNYGKTTGQIDEIFNANEDIYEIIYDKLYFESSTLRNELYTLDRIIIEAPQYATFMLNDEEIMIGETGLYISPSDNEIHYDSITYLGMKDAGSGSIVATPCAALVTYQGIYVKKILKES